MQHAWKLFVLHRNAGVLQPLCIRFPFVRQNVIFRGYHQRRRQAAQIRRVQRRYARVAAVHVLWNVQLPGIKRNPPT